MISLTLTLLLGIITFFIILIYKNYMKQYEDIDKLPGPSAIKLIRELYFNTSSKGIVAYFYTLTKIYGPIVKVWINPFKPLIITHDMEFCKKLLKTNDHHETTNFNDVTFMANGIAVNNNYEERKLDKHIMTKALNVNYVSRKLSIYEQRYNHFLDTIRSNANKPINVENEFHKILMDILMETLQHPGVHVSKEEIQKFNDNRHRFFNLLFEKMNSLRYIGFLHKFSNNYRLMRTCHNEIMNFTFNWLEKFKKLDMNSRDKSNFVYEMVESGVSEKRIAGNLNSLIEGGHTMIHSLTMALKKLAEDSKIQENAFNEVANLIGLDVSKELTLDDIDKMPYLDAFTKEVVRLYFPLPFLERTIRYDMTIGDIKVPKGTQVLFDFPGILTSENYFDDSLDFKPSRFFKENVTLKSQTAFLGFGYGVKACPGKLIAYAVIKLLIVKIIREFEIIHVDREVELVADLFFKSTNGVYVAFKKRNI